MKNLMFSIMVMYLLPVAVNASDMELNKSGFYIGLGYGIGTVQGPSLRARNEASALQVSTLVNTSQYIPTRTFTNREQQLKDNVNISEIHIGYDVNPFISFELGYADYELASKTFNVDFYDANSGGPGELDYSRNIDINVFSLTTLIKYPIYHNLSVYGLVSYDKVSVEPQWQSYRHDTEEHNKLGYGAGLRWAFSEDFAAKLQWKKTSNMRVKGEILNLSDTRLVFEMSL